jgi:phosphoribosylformylglycinamidine cyclo-ligase
MAPVTYKNAGVNIDAADAFIAKIKPLVRYTLRPEVLGGIGGFSGLFRPNLRGMKNPVLVSSTDGVGTKLMIADLQRRYDTVGIDLVAMSVDDVIVTGAEPLFFLDYIACGRLDKDMLAEVMKGIVKGCREANCALVGGETAELPGLYAKDQWDLAGFCVGIVDRAKIIDGRRCRKGDAVIGLASRGLHSNGYSLARKVFTEKELKGPIGRELLKPTRIYTRAILSVLKKVPIKAMAHITGGGFYDNIPRVIPVGLRVKIRESSWPIPDIFRMIQEKGGVDEREMFRTLNMGIGMAVVVAAKDAARTVALFKTAKIPAYVIGELVPGPHEVTIE